MPNVMSFLRPGLSARSAAVAAIAVSATFALSGVGVASAEPFPESLLAFGWNNEGELANSTNTGSMQPNPSHASFALPQGSGQVIELAAGNVHSFALTSTGNLYAWGDNFYGELGTTTNNGNSSPNPTPELVHMPAGAGSVTQISAGFDFTLATTSSGDLYAFGTNGEGQLGRTPNTGTNLPAKVTLPGQNGAVTQIAAGDTHSLVATASGQLYGFGDNYYGELTGTTDNGVGHGIPTPTLISLPAGSGTVTQLAAGIGDSLVLTSSGILYGFGNNAAGQITGPPGIATTPHQIVMPAGSGAVTQIAAGGYHNLVLTSTGALYSLGADDFGQLGLGMVTPSEPTPQRVAIPGQVGTITQIAASWASSMVVTSSGQLFTFGENNYGQLGIFTTSGTTTPNPTPTLIPLSPTTIDTVAKGGVAEHTLALFSDLAITSGSFPTGRAGNSYTVPLTVMGGAAPFHYSAAGLPPGLAINATTGNVSGTPTAFGHFNAALTVTDRFGSAASKTFTFDVLPAVTSVSNASETHRSWREGSKLATFTAKRKPPVGTTFSFKLNERAGVTFTFVQQLQGRKLNGRCVSQTSQNRHKPSCQRTLTRGTLSFVGRSGANKVTFDGRLSASKRLRPGNYKLVIVAKANGIVSRPRTLSFTIVPG